MLGSHSPSAYIKIQYEEILMGVIIDVTSDYRKYIVIFSVCLESVRTFSRQLKVTVFGEIMWFCIHMSGVYIRKKEITCDFFK